MKGISARQVLNVIGVLVLVVMIVPFVAFSFPQVIGAEESYVVKSGSMSPAIETGSVIFVYEADPATIEEGDIITYNLGGPARQVTTHRVVGIEKNDGLVFRTKGDANEEPDQYVVPASAVVGTVPVLVESVRVPGVGYVEEYPFTIPYLGRIIIFAGSRTGIVLFVFVPAGLLILSELFVLGRAYWRQRKATTDGGREPEDPSAEPAEPAVEEVTDEASPDAAVASGDGEGDTDAGFEFEFPSSEPTDGTTADGSDGSTDTRSEHTEGDGTTADSGDQPTNAEEER